MLCVLQMALQFHFLFLQMVRTEAGKVHTNIQIVSNAALIKKYSALLFELYMFLTGVHE